MSGLPPFTAPSQAFALLRTSARQLGLSHWTLALDEDLDDAPRFGWPFIALPVLGSLLTKSEALLLDEVLVIEQPPLLRHFTARFAPLDP